MLKFSILVNFWLIITFISWWSVLCKFWSFVILSWILNKYFSKKLTLSEQCNNDQSALHIIINCLNFFHLYTENNLTIAADNIEDPLQLTNQQFVDDFISPSSPPPPIPQHQQQHIAPTTTVVADYAELLSAAAENVDHHSQMENNMEFDSETDLANDTVEHGK